GAVAHGRHRHYRGPRQRERYLRKARIVPRCAARGIGADGGAGIREPLLARGSIRGTRATTAHGVHRARSSLTREPRVLFLQGDTFARFHAAMCLYVATAVQMSAKN